LKAEYINAFLEPAIRVIEKSLNVKSTIGQIKKGTGTKIKYPLSVIIGMKGDLSGAVILGFSMKTAQNIVANMLKKKKVTKIDQEEKEALSELANMIVGNACGSLYEMGLKETLTPPTVIAGSQMSFSIPEINVSITIPVKNKLGTFELNIFLKDERAA
jgi:chemotaxis protein CheX